MTLLKKLALLEKEAEAFGFAWENTDQIMAQIKSEWTEIHEHLGKEEHLAKTKLQEEIGDLLHAVFSLCYFCGFDLEETVGKSMYKFAKRFYHVKKLALSAGYTTLKGCSFEDLMAFWDKAKQAVG